MGGCLKVFALLQNFQTMWHSDAFGKPTIIQIIQPLSEVDSGKMRGLDVDASSAVRHLSERWVSRAGAQQRAGRAGRTGPGRCFRLFSERQGKWCNNAESIKGSKFSTKFMRLRSEMFGRSDLAWHLTQLRSFGGMASTMVIPQAFRRNGTLHCS